MWTQSLPRPLISCLMTTRRPAIARRAIDRFAVQDYEPRELVVVAGPDGYDELSAYASAVCGADRVVTYMERGAPPLGALRNRAVALARGEVICQWDDDDLSHSRRLSMQFEQMRQERACACFMTDQLQFVTRTRSLYWCDWTQTRGFPLRTPTIPGTLMCYREAAPPYPESGPLSRRSEDAFVMRSLLKAGPVARLSGYGWLFVYTSHGDNTWPESHHLDIVRVTGMDAANLQRRRHDLAEAIADYELDADIVVRDYLGAPVFTLDELQTAGARSVSF
jgi:glycosyltransferase involved in cell wall biosynthesis